MVKKAQKQSFNDEFCLRTRNAREARGFKQAEMAEVLGLETDTYSKYERRTPLPHRLIPRFCLVCGLSLDDLFGARPVARILTSGEIVGKKRGL